MVLSADMTAADGAEVGLTCRAAATTTAASARSSARGENGVTLVASTAR